MSAMLHVVHGVDAGSNLADALGAAPSEIAASLDSMDCGPLPAVLEIDDWCTIRADFWARVYERSVRRGPRAKVARRFKREMLEWMGRLADAAQITLWVGTDIGEQLLLAWMPSLLPSIGKDPSMLCVVEFDQLEQARRTVRLSGLTIDRIRAHPPARPLQEPERAVLNDAWNALTSSDPDDFRQFFRRSTATTRALDRTMRTLLSHYPDVVSGLNWYDTQLLAATQACQGDLAQVVAHTLDTVRNTASHTAGDVWLCWRLLRLGEPTIPLPAVTIEHDASSFWRSAVRLTAAGERILEGGTNFVVLNGLDDWVGGVHLDSRAGNVWYHHNGTLVRRGAELR